MDYVNFGTAGVKVSPLALGLGLRGQGDEAEAQHLIEHALDLGINLIDCSNIYGPMDDRANIGRSEVILGKAIRGKRDDVVITSKVFGRVGPGPNDSGLSRYHILREIERSLKRLNTDHIDVYIAHVFDKTTPLDETLRAFDDLIRSGKVRYIGCSNYAAWQVCRALWISDSLMLTPYMCVQNEYSLLNRTLEQEMFGLAVAQGLGMMAYSPLAVGLLTGAYSPDQLPTVDSAWAKRNGRQIVERLRNDVRAVLSTTMDLATELGKTPAQLAIAWVLAQPEITVAILGADTIAHLEENIGAVGWTLDEVVKEKLDVVSNIFVNSGVTERH